MDEAVSRVLANLGLDAKPFRQEKVIELVKNPLSGAWTTVYSHHTDANRRPSVLPTLHESRRSLQAMIG